MGTTLEILAPYRPYGIDVRVMGAAGFTARLIGLSFSSATQHPVQVDSDDNTVTCWPYADCLPILRSFPDLTTPLPDGTVPIKRIVELQKGLVCDPKRHIKLEEDAIWCRWSEDQEWTILFDERYLYHQHDMTAHAADYLRRLHFAVGMTREQFIRK